MPPCERRPGKNGLTFPPRARPELARSSERGLTRGGLTAKLRLARCTECTRARRPAPERICGGRRAGGLRGGLQRWGGSGARRDWAAARLHDQFVIFRHSLEHRHPDLVDEPLPACRADSSTRPVRHRVAGATCTNTNDSPPSRRFTTACTSARTTRPRAARRSLHSRHASGATTSADRNMSAPIASTIVFDLRSWDEATARRDSAWYIRSA